MFELNFAVEDVAPVLFAASPALAYKLRVTSSDPEQDIHNVLLQCQVRIEAARRRYSNDEQQHLIDLFGEPDRWSETLHAMLWTHAGVMVPPFQGMTIVELHVPCSFDFNVAATKYFHGLEDGDVPLTFLFSGSIFYAAEGGGLQVTRIAWEKEAKFRLPVRAWKEMMDHYHPCTAWLCLNSGTFAQLYAYKLRTGLATWEQTIDSLLAASSSSLVPTSSRIPANCNSDAVSSQVNPAEDPGP